VPPSDTAVIAPVPTGESYRQGGRYITLTTCHPEFGASERFIVNGTLTGWAPLAAGIPAEPLPANTA